MSANTHKDNSDKTSTLIHCPNRVRGCEEYDDTNSKEQNKQHKVWCVFRLVKCPRISCGQVLPFHSLLEHMEKFKDFSVKYITEFGKPVKNDVTIKEEYFNRGSFTFRPVIVEIDGHVFLSILVENTRIVFHWIQLYGSRWEAEKFLYVLEYYGGSGGKRECLTSYRGQVLAIDETPTDIEDHCKCFTIAFKALKAQFIVNRSFCYSVRIERIQENC